MNSPYSSILSSISVIATSNAGDRGKTGSIVSKSGVSSEGPSGDSKYPVVYSHRKYPVLWTTNRGRGDSIYISVGVGDDGVGGDIKILSGSTTAMSSSDASYMPTTATGGSIELVSGASHAASSGEISIATADAGRSGMSGHIRIKTGDATSGMTGYIGELAHWQIVPSLNLLL